MPALYCSSSRLVLVLVLAAAATPALAGSFTVPPASGQQTVSGSDTGSIAAGETLSGTPSAIQWNAAASTTPGVVITNDGTISSTGRGIDTTSNVTGSFTLDNNSTVSSTDDAFRINGALANGQVVVDNAGEIKSKNGQALDFDKANSATAQITIDNSGTISSAGSDAIRLGGGTIEITNSGTIETTSSGKRGIKFDTASSFDTLQSFTLTNEAGGTVTGTDDGIKISSTAGSTAAPTITIDNAGTIRSTGDGQGIDLGDISSVNATITITNRAGGVISAANNDGIKGTNGLTIDNYGTISSSYAAGTASTQNNSAVKVDGDDISKPITVTVNNYAGATISGAYHGVKASGASDTLIVTNSGTIEGRNGSGVNSNGTGTLTNSGTITGTFDPAADFGDGDGVDFDQAGTIVNNGTIKGLGSKGVKPGEVKPSTSEGIAIGGGSVTNGTAANTSALISGANNGILVDDSNSGDAFAAMTVTNYGTIEGLDGYGIRYVNSGVDPSKSLTVINYGTISGTTFAVQMGGGDDLFVTAAGSQVAGIVDAEGGFDTLALRSASEVFDFDLSLVGDSATYRHFEEVTAEGIINLSGTSTFAGTMNMGQNGSFGLDNLNAPDAHFKSEAGASGPRGIWGQGTIGSLEAVDLIIDPSSGPSNATGTISVKGDVSLTTTTYWANINPDGSSDLIDVGGKTTLIGSDNSVLVFGQLDWGARYTLLSSAGGVEGTFGSLTTYGPSYLFIAPELSYDATHVFLSLERNGVSFFSYALTPNQRAVAGALERIDASGQSKSSALFGAFASQTVDDNPTLALAQLSGDIFATLPGQITTENMLVNDLILGRVRQAGYTGAQGATGALGAGGPALSYAAPQAAPGPFGALKPAAGAPVWTGWAQGYGQWLSTDGNGNAAGADTSLGGMLMGADVAIGNTVFGLAAGYASASTSAGSASADTETWTIAAYGGASFDALKLRAGASYGWSSIDSQRFVALTGEAPRAAYDGTAGNVFAEAGYTFTLGTVALEPFAGLAWTGVDLGGFVESNAPVAGLVSGGTSFDTPYSTLGVRLAAAFDVGHGARVTPHASAGWRHAFGDVTPTAALAFINTGTPFGIEGVAIAEDSLVASLGLDFTFANGVTFAIAYDGMTGDGASYNAGKAALSVKF